jgi:hypothetical protein
MMRRALALALACLALMRCTLAPSPSAMEPISYATGESRIRLVFLGHYTMGFFGAGGAGPALYDPPSRRLFVVNADRGWIDAVDIADPAAPRLVKREVLLDDGTPESIALSQIGRAHV